MQDEPKGKPKSLLIIIAVAILIGVGYFLGKSGNSEPVEVDLSEVERRDSIIAAHELTIGDLTEKVTERDSVIIFMVGRESEQRDTIFHHLENRFVGASDSTKEDLINEALNAIQ